MILFTRLLLCTDPRKESIPLKRRANIGRNPPLSIAMHESFPDRIKWNMKNRKPYIFLITYFLVIFLWLLFCYRQVQKACSAAGHTVSESAFKILPGSEENEFLDNFGKEYLFQGNRDNNTDVEEAEKMPENEQEKQMTGEQSAEEQETVSEKGKAGEENGTVEKADTEKIRVVLLGTGGVFHKEIILEAGGETLTITADSPYFEKTDIIRVRIAKGNDPLQVKSLDRACGHPFYDGVLEVRKTGEGLVLINEISLEDYVKGVLPSEMPSSYPLEALKAQAVCARTYAKMKQENKAYPQYDAAVDDSTACQVYRNLETSMQGDQAVAETAGEVLQKKDGSYTECYYYSTSCGRGTQISVWHGGETERPEVSGSAEDIVLMNQEFFDYIREIYDDHVEAEEAFYRWEYKCEETKDQNIFDRCRKRQQINGRLVWAEGAENGEEREISKGELGNIKEMSVVERQEGGVADCIKISCEKGTVYVWGEYNIRYVLAQGGTVKLQNDTTYAATELLPSAFISLQSICNEKGNMVGYIVVGGGFGHGVGMSQNGAKNMALAGNTYQEILETYYGK